MINFFWQTWQRLPKQNPDGCKEWQYSGKQQAGKSNYKVKPGDVISVLLPGPVKEFEIIAENIPINIVYEDDDIIVINKDAGMVVHPGHGNYTGTLINALAFYFQDNPDVLPALIHRIDKDTSGILLVGKKRISTNYTCQTVFRT